jgi:hypothetical protein
VTGDEALADLLRGFEQVMIGDLEEGKIGHFLTTKDTKGH